MTAKDRIERYGYDPLETEYERMEFTRYVFIPEGQTLEEAVSDYGTLKDCEEDYLAAVCEEQNSIVSGKVVRIMVKEMR